MLHWLKAQIGDKPAWAIFAAAVIAAAGGALVAAVPGLVGWTVRIFEGGDTVGFLARDAATTKPLEGVRISILSIKTLQPMAIGANGSKEIVTRSNGLARARIDLTSADFTMEARYDAGGATYIRTDPLLLKDGKLFTINFQPDTWAREGRKAPEPTVATAVAAKTLTLVKGAPQWMEIARGELGQREAPGAQDNPRVLAYLRSIQLDSGGDAMQWNSAFVNWALVRAGVPGTNSGMARSWLAWGKQSPLVPGCIAVFWRQSPTSAMGHVGFFVREAGGTLEILGGNQSDSVSVALIDRSRLLDCRMPA